MILAYTFLHAVTGLAEMSPEQAYEARKRPWRDSAKLLSHDLEKRRRAVARDIPALKKLRKHRP